MWQTAVGALLVLGSFVSFTGMLIIKRRLGARRRARTELTSLRPLIGPHWQIFLDATFHHWWIAYAVLIASTDLYLSIAYVLNLLRLRKKSGDPRFKRFLAIMVEIALTSFAPTAAMSLAFAVATIISIENPVSRLWQAGTSRIDILRSSPSHHLADLLGVLQLDAGAQRCFIALHPYVALSSTLRGSVLISSLSQSTRGPIPQPTPPLPLTSRLTPMKPSPRLVIALAWLTRPARRCRRVRRLAASIPTLATQ